MSKDVMNVAFLSLGGNLGRRLENINTAIKALKAAGNEVIKTSSVYQTAAWGSNSKKKYLNQVLKIKTGLNAAQLLKQILMIEEKMGRKRSHDQNADRTIDIDILFFNSEHIQSNTLLVPHPKMHLRKFVLVPLNEIENKYVHPLLKKTINNLLNRCNDELEVDLYKRVQPVKYICIEGNIGSGKTTLAKALAKKLNAVYLPEVFEDNLLLPLFYANPGLYAFALEYDFFVGRFKQLIDALKNNEKTIVSDFSIFKCLWFAKVNLSRKEYALFKKTFNVLTAQLLQPDLVVYLDTSINNLKHNIKKRGRPYEKDISKTYLKSLAKEYHNGMKYLKNVKKLVIPVTKYHPKLELDSIKTIEEHLNTFI